MNRDADDAKPRRDPDRVPADDAGVEDEQVVSLDDVGPEPVEGLPVDDV